MLECEEDNIMNAPFLTLEIEEEYFSLLQQKRIFDENIKEISQLTENLSFEESSNVLLLKSKFENISNQMDKIVKNINYLQNIIPEDDFNMGLKTKILADNIQKKFKKANIKFKNAILNAQNALDEELSFTSDFSTTQEKSRKSSTVSDQVINKEKIERLNKTKKEYEKIYNITNSLNILSEEIKFNTINQGEKIDIIDGNMSNVDDNINKGNNELKKYIRNNYDENSFYYRFATGVAIGALFLFFLIYLKFCSSRTALDQAELK